jgi:hypothetical protein
MNINNKIELINLLNVNTIAKNWHISTPACRHVGQQIPLSSESMILYY